MMGRPSVAPYRAGQRDLITMSSPSPCKPDRDPGQQNSSLLEAEQEGEEQEEAGEAESREREFQAGLQQREQSLLQLQAQLQERDKEVAQLREQLKLKLDSEDQMKQVVAEYERTISELIADKEKDKAKLEVS